MSERGGRAPGERAPAGVRVGIVLGSGLGAVAEAVGEPVVVGYEELPGFPRPTVAGHAGRAVLGRIGGVPVAVLQGRAHLYEGGPLDAIRELRSAALRAAGAEILVLTNAAGSLRPEVGPGRLMAITDHINLTGVNVLIGPERRRRSGRASRRWATRTTRSCWRQLRAAAAAARYRARRGRVPGGQRPELRDPRRDPRVSAILGADAVGMSTVHETIVARHCGLRVAAISAITNLAEGMSECRSATSRRSPTPRAPRDDLIRLLARLHRADRRPMLVPELIRRKRDGGELTAAEIEELVAGITDGSVSDAQVGAFAMAIVWRGMTSAERVALTGAMMRSGEVLDWARGSRPARCSTSTRPAASATRSACCWRRSSPPAVASVPMISGRGLGHTGGTLDKLESIPGYDVAPDLEPLTRRGRRRRLRDHRPDGPPGARPTGGCTRSATRPGRSSRSR